MSSESTSRRPSPNSRRTALVVAVCVVAMIAVVAAALTERKPAARSAAPSTTASSTTEAPTTTSTTAPRVTVPPTTSAPTTAPPTTTRPRPTTSTSASTVPPAPVSGSLHGLAGKTIVIDPGHGGNASHASEINRPIFIGTGYRNCNTVGTETNGGYAEHAYTFDVALRVRAILEGAGAHVVMTRTNDTGVGPCIDVRAAIGNQAHAGAVVAIHGDGGPASGRGSCVYMPALTPGYTDDIYAASHRLGVALRDGYRAVSGVPTANYACSDGLAEANNYGGLNLSNVPAVLFETVNMRNATDAAYIGQSSDRQRIAEGIAAGLARYFAG